MAIDFICGCSFPTKKLKELMSVEYSVDDIRFDCSKTWELIAEGNTKGCFQLESRLGQSMSKKLKPSNIEELAALISIMRPGCLEAVRDDKTVSNHYIDKKNGLESVDYFHEALEPILQNTYGEMVYQEQAMEIAKDIAGFNLQEADMLRKAIGKKRPEEMAKIKSKFIDGCDNKKTVSKDEAEQIFGWIEKSQRYSFNKSHAVSYAINGYLSAHAKTHFPKIFFLSYLKFAKDKIDPQEEMLQLINNAKDMNIDIVGPSILIKNSDFIIQDDKIYFGLTNIKGLGQSLYTKLIEMVDQIPLNTISWPKFLLSVLLKINSSAAKALILSGALDHFKISRNKLLFEFNIVSILTTREIDKCIIIIEEDRKITKIADILRTLLSTEKIIKTRQPKIMGSIEQITHPPYSLEDNPEWISDNERELLSVAISCYKTDQYDSSYANTNCKDIKTLPNNKTFFLIAEIAMMNIIVTKRGKTPGKEMCFLTLSDAYGSVDSPVMFSEDYENNKHLLQQGRVLMFSGQKSGKNNSPIIKKCFIV